MFNIDRQTALEETRRRLENYDDFRDFLFHFRHEPHSYTVMGILRILEEIDANGAFGTDRKDLTALLSEPS